MSKSNERPLHVLNSHSDIELTVYASRGGDLVKCRLHNTDIALAVAHNWMLLGWNIEIDDADNYTVYFDSDYDLIQLDDDGNYKAIYIIGTR